MDIFDKLSNVAKKVGDKTTEVAKMVGDKAEDVIEAGKLTAKITAERHDVQEDLKKIGEYYYLRFMQGDEVAPEVLGYCNSAKSHYNIIAQAQEELRRLKENSGVKEENDEEEVVMDVEGEDIPTE